MFIFVDLDDPSLNISDFIEQVKDINQSITIYACSSFAVDASQF